MAAVLAGTADEWDAGAGDAARDQGPGGRRSWRSGVHGGRRRHPGRARGAAPRRQRGRRRGRGRGHAGRDRAVLGRHRRRRLLRLLRRPHQAVHTIDGREAAPAAMQENAFVNPATGLPYAFQEARVSGISVGVPGTLRPGRPRCASGAPSPCARRCARRPGRRAGLHGRRDVPQPDRRQRRRVRAVQLDQRAVPARRRAARGRLDLPQPRPRPHLPPARPAGTDAFYRGELAGDIVAPCSTRRSPRHRRYRGRSRSGPAR